MPTWQALDRLDAKKLHLITMSARGLGSNPRALWDFEQQTRKMKDNYAGSREGGSRKNSSKDWLRGRRARRELGNRVAPEVIRRPEGSRDRRLRSLFKGERGLPFKPTADFKVRFISFYWRLEDEPIPTCQYSLPRGEDFAISLWIRS